MNNLTFLKNYFLIFLLTYTICLITKFIFVIYLNDNFSDITNYAIINAIFQGYKFDLAVTAMTAFIITLFDFNKKLILVFAPILLVFVWLTQISDILYFYESSRHVGYEAKDALQDAKGLIMTAFSQHTMLSIIALLTSILLYFISAKLLANYTAKIHINKYYLVKKIILLIITVFFVRGMMQGIPLNPWQSNQIGDSKLSSISLNGTYNLLYSLVNQSKKLSPAPLPTIEKSLLEKNFKELYQSNYIPFKTTLQKPNVVIFYLESWSAINMKSYGFDLSEIAPTPFYDTIVQKSIRPKAMIAGGHRTTEGIFASVTSYQNPLGKTIAKTQLQDFKYNSVINILTQNGYKSLFFQGSAKETSGTGSLAQSLGFQQSYGKHDIKTRIYEENYWGVHDPDLYNYVIEKLQNIKKPFIIGINGATTHDNKIPQSIQPISFVKNQKINAKLNALHFSDRALKDFMLKMEKTYPNTLFVFLADHCGGVKGSSFLNYMIPFAIYHKDLKEQYLDTYLSQRDVAPTILDATLGEYKKYTNNFSGKSLFSDQNFFADYYHNGTLGWIEGQKALELNTITNQYKCYDLSNYKDKEIQCTEGIISFKYKSLSFTTISQNLLFKGKTDELKEYK